MVKKRERIDLRGGYYLENHDGICYMFQPKGTVMPYMPWVEEDAREFASAMRHPDVDAEKDGDPYPEKLGVICFNNGNYELDKRSPEVPPNVTYVRKDMSPSQDALKSALDSWHAIMSLVPMGQEDVVAGASTYNWMRRARDHFASFLNPTTPPLTDKEPNNV